MGRRENDGSPGKPGLGDNDPKQMRQNPKLANKPGTYTGSNSSGGGGTDETGQGSTTSTDTTLRQPAPTPSELGAGYPATSLTDGGFSAGASPPPDPNAPYGNTPAILNPGLEIQNEIINQGKPVGWALSSSLFSVYAQSQNALEAVSKSDALLNNTTFNGQTQTFGNITPTDIQPLYTAIDNNTGNIAFLNLNRDTSLTVTDLNGINTVKSDISNPVLMNRLNVPATIPDINASISQTTSNTISTTIDSIGLTPLSNLNNSLNQPLPSNKININSKDHQLAILKALNSILNPNEKNDQLNPLSKVFEHLFKDSNKNKLEELKMLIEKQLGRNLNSSHEFDKPYLKNKTRTTLLLSELLTASLINKNNVLKDTSSNFKQFVSLLLTKLEQKHNNANNTKFTTSQKALNILTKTYNTNELALKNTLKMFSANFENLLSAKLSNRQIPGRLALESNNMANHDFTNLFLLNLKTTQGIMR